MKSVSPSKAVASPSMKKLPHKSSVEAEDICTPEKPIQMPRRSRNRGVALSVKEVKRVALGLQRSSVDRSGVASSNDDLVSVEAELGENSPNKSSPTKTKSIVKLPEKYEMLSEFFNSMDSSIRLLRMKGSITSFPNICNSIQHLTERRFTYRHLAQLKYILPEAILIKKVLLHDEVTCCMKPALQVNLQVEAIAKSKKAKDEISSSALRKIFRERLVDFLKNHPEGEEVPAEELPHPFNKESASLGANDLSVHSNSASVEHSASSTNLQKIAAPSHLSGSFQKRFSARGFGSNSEKTSLLCASKASLKDGDSIAFSPTKCTSRPPVPKWILPNSEAISASSSKYENDKDTGKLEQIESGTPAREVSTPMRLMTATPEMATPKRRLTDNCDSLIETRSAKRTTRTKLFMTPTKSTHVEEESEKRSSSLDDDDVLNILPKSLLQSIKEKEKKAAQDRDSGVSDAIKRQKMIATLPNIFNMILLIFQSWKRSVMTKNELMHKLISNNCKIVDRGEVEEQLKLLQELVPDWISERVSYSGDVLCSINKVSSPEDIRQRLSAAK